MSEDGRPAVFVGTMLQTGDAVALCDECLVAWSAALLYTMTGVDPEPFLRAISDDEPPAETDTAGTDAGGVSDVPTTSEGAPSDEPPAPAPADEDSDPPIGRTKGGYPVGRSRRGSSDPPTATGDGDDDAAPTPIRKPKRAS
jgi:hypothetical protein